MGLSAGGGRQQCSYWKRKLWLYLQDKRLLENALTHSSYANEHRGK